jgi:hypothetical protein
MIDRHEFAEELKLRGQVRKIVRIIKEHRKKETNQTILEESRMRKVIRKLLVEADTSKPESSPHQKTGINVLEDLLHNIIPQIKDDYMQLTTDKEQRTSFRRHMVYNVMDLLKPPTVNAEAPGGAESKFIPISEQEEIELKVGGQGGDEPMPPEFISGADPDDIPEEIPDDEKEKTEFGIPGEEITGRDFALETFNKVSSQILQAYNKLGNEEDRELFYDYLKTNLQLYFDKFENEITVDLPEPPASPEYEAAKGDMASPEGAMA